MDRIKCIRCGAESYNESGETPITCNTCYDTLQAENSRLKELLKLRGELTVQALAALTKPVCSTCGGSRKQYNRIDGGCLIKQPCPDCPPKPEAEPSEIEGFEEWFASEYPLPPTIERGPIGRDFKDGCQKAWVKGCVLLKAQASFIEQLEKKIAEQKHTIADLDISFHNLQPTEWEGYHRLKQDIKLLQAEINQLQERLQSLYTGDLSPESRMSGYKVVVEALKKRRDELIVENERLQLEVRDLEQKGG